MVSCPKITMKKVDGVKMEPIENLSIECDLKHVSFILDMLMARQANIQDQIAVEDSESDRQRIIADIPTRGLVGLKLILQGETANSVTLENSFYKWEEHRGGIEKKQKSCLIASSDGTATNYGISGLEKFGVFFIKPTQKIYAGQIVGVSNDKEENINVCKEKKMTNIRAAGNDEYVKLNPPRVFTIEESISFIGDEDYVEITRDHLRFRKKELNADVRKNMKKKNQVDNELYID